MLELFRKYIDQRAVITDEEFGRIASLSRIKKLRKRQYLLQEGEVCRNHAFITKGCLRTYNIDGKGQEHIIYFAMENWWIADRESLMAGTPSRFNIDAIEDSELVLIGKADFALLCKEIPAFNEMVGGVIDKSFVNSQNRIHISISYNAEEKYRHFIEKYPDFVNRIPQHMIASYLGITPETLSRIRKHGAGK